MGLGFTKSFVEHGADVLIASRKEDKLRLAFEEIKKETGKEISWKVMDVRDNEAVENVAGFISKEWGELDILVNNAAGNFIAPVSSMSENAWRAVVDIVLDGTFRVSKSCYPLLRKAKRGASIVNIIANYAWNAAPFVGHSGAAKAGVLNLTRTLALEWSKDNIRVNAISPGAIATPIFWGGSGVSNTLSDEENERKLKKLEGNLAKAVPLKRSGHAVDIAEAALYLASDAGSFVTCQDIVVDGGRTAMFNEDS